MVLLFLLRVQIYPDVVLGDPIAIINVFAVGDLASVERNKDVEEEEDVQHDVKVESR